MKPQQTLSQLAKNCHDLPLTVLQIPEDTHGIVHVEGGINLFRQVMETYSRLSIVALWRSVLTCDRCADSSIQNPLPIPAFHAEIRARSAGLID